MLISRETLKQAMPYATNANLDRFIGPLNDVMVKYGINTRRRMCAFLAQLAHESGSLRYVEEIASGDAYDTRVDLGNTPERDGDGRKYKGRGLIQLTGKTNYKLFSKEFNVDAVNNPTLLKTPYYASLTAGWFWHKRSLNKYADLGTEAGFKTITKRINGGLSGYADRVKHWKHCLAAIK